MTTLATLARRRAFCAARLEAFSGEVPSTDREERIAFAVARAKAQAAYRVAEEAYQRAVATLSPEEAAERSGVAA